MARSRSHRSEQELQISPSCGGAEILRKAFEFLEDSHTRRDLGRRLADFICTNGSVEDIDEQWLASAQGALGRDVEAWLWIGRELGALRRVDKGDVSGVLGDGLFDERIVDLLCSAGRYDCVLTSDANSALLRSRLLEAPVRWHPANSGGEPLYLLPMFLSQPTFIGVDPGIYRYDRHFEVLDRFKEARSARKPDLAMTFDLSRQAFELSCKIADLASGDGLKRSPLLELEGLVEETRQILGDWPSILFAANQISHMPRGSRSRLKHANLASRDRAICDRVRTAKSQTKNATWWSKQLSETNDAADRFLFHLTYWSWAAPEVVFEMADDVASDLDHLAPKEWSTLLRFLPLAMEPLYFERARDLQENQPLPRKLRSHRLAFLVGLKAPAVYGRAVFLGYFRTGAREPHVEVASFRQFWAVEAALAGALPWQSALSIVRSTYTQGASHYLMGFMFRERVILPDSVVDTILARAGSYPVPIWELAEGIASARARKAIRAVAKVAREERWFAN